MLSCLLGTTFFKFKLKLITNPNPKIISSGFNESVKIYPMYEPSDAAEKINNLGNLTLDGSDEGVNINLTIHAVRGGHVTVYFNSTSPAVK